MEVFLENRIKQMFPLTRCLYNDRQTLLTELDFYFPDLRLAIELNGIVHYEPIYGSNQFDKIQNRDKQKQTLCATNGIELIVVPNFGSFSTKISELMWHEIKTIIETRIVE